MGSAFSSHLAGSWGESTSFPFCPDLCVRISGPARIVCKDIRSCPDPCVRISGPARLVCQDIRSCIDSCVRISGPARLVCKDISFCEVVVCAHGFSLGRVNPRQNAYLYCVADFEGFNSCLTM